VAAALYEHALAFHRGSKDTRLAPLEDCRQQISVSPDGRWVATGGHEGNYYSRGDARIWSAGTGELVKVMGIGTGCHVCFSPDGKWLVITRRSDLRLIQTGTWKEMRTDRKPSQGFCAISPDSRWLATERGDGAIRLEEVVSGKELAILEGPLQGRTPYLCFSPDGTLLIATNVDHQVIHVWDLRKLRVQLSRLGLDWSGPTFPPEPPEQRRPADVRPLEVQIVGEK
jgi:WD40 repeat protein